MERKPATPAPQPRPSGTIRQLLHESIARHADRVFLLSPGRRDLTYAGLGAQVQRVANVLADAGLGRGRRVALALPHGPEFAVALLAACCVTTCAPLNDQLTEDGLLHLLRSMRIDALIAPAGTDSAAVRAARRLALAVVELRVDPDAPAGVFEPVLPLHGAAGPAEPPAADDLALVANSSGTTGTPKIIPFPHWLLVESAHRRVQIASIEPSDRILTILPFYSSVAIRRLLLPAIVVGASVIVPTHIDGATLVSTLASQRPTQLMAPPVVLIAMLEDFERRRPRPPHALRFITSSFTELAPDVRRQLELAFGVPLVVTYGMSECGSIAEMPLPPRTAPPGSVGLPTLLDVAIADAAGGFLAAGETGEIVVRGTEVIRGYENDDEANAAAFRDGWFRTGDAGRIDRDGFVYLAGRIKDLINRGGNKIAPSEIEDVLRRHPQVIDAAAFAVPHPTLGEDVVAAVVLREPRPDEGGLRRFMRSRLATFKMPSRILPMKELPRGALGKISRVELALKVRTEAADDLAPARTPEETEVARIFADVLELPSVGRNGNFFQLGGDSLGGVRVLAAVEWAFGIRLELDLLFDHPSVAEFAERIGAAKAARIPHRQGHLT
jgi:acyl-CoA synthetase (AMP-forming)/AMP-acid ligase II/acyl carrier protein